MLEGRYQQHSRVRHSSKLCNVAEVRKGSELLEFAGSASHRLEKLALKSTSPPAQDSPSMFIVFFIVSYK